MRAFVSYSTDWILDRLLDLRYFPYGSHEEHAFLNIVMTELRPAGIEQKARSFFSIIELCLKQKRFVRILVPLGRGSVGGAEAAYLNTFNSFLGEQGFELTFASPSSARRHYVTGAIVAFFFSRFLRKSFPVTRRNIAVLLASNYLRVRTFFKLFDDFPAKNWLGLTGNIELQALQCRRDSVGSSAIVSALQFGQASMDQYHFSTYSVDQFFVYDIVSREVYRKLGIKAGTIIVSGSPEFELSLSKVSEQPLEVSPDLVVLFIDQPVRQRSEYSEQYTQSIYRTLRSISKYSGVALYVKPHPRGSAFPEPLLSESQDRDISDLLSEAHVVVGFFSNLMDLALLTGRETFCFGADRVLDHGKVQWMLERECNITNDVRDLERFIQATRSPIDLTRKVIERRKRFMSSESPSERIIKSLGGEDVT